MIAVSHWTPQVTKLINLRKSKFYKLTSFLAKNDWILRLSLKLPLSSLNEVIAISTVIYIEF